jgi:hypothetical protein
MSEGVKVDLRSDSSQYRRDIKDAGDLGDAQLERLNRASGKAADGMADLGDKTGAAAGSAHDASGKFGPLDRILSGIGPQALAAGAALAAAGVAAGVLFDQAQKAISFGAEIDRTAESIGVTAEQLQGLRGEAREAGKDFGSMESAIEGFGDKVTQAASGSGDLYRILKENDPTLLKAVQSHKNVNDQLAAYIIGVQGYANATDRAVLLQAAFGDAGQDVLDVLGDIEGAMEGAGQKSVAMGEAISNETAKAAREMETEWNDMMGRLETRLKGFMLNIVTAPKKAQSFMDMTLANDQANRDAENGIYNEFAGSKPQFDADQSEDKLKAGERQLEKLVALRENLLAKGMTDSADVIAGYVEKQTENVEGLSDAYQIAQKALEAYNKAQAESDKPAPRRIKPAATKTTTTDTSAANDRLRLEREAAQVLLSQNDITAAFAIETARVNKLRAAGLLTETQATAELERAANYLREMTPMGKENAKNAAEWEQRAKGYADAIEDAITAEEKLAAAIDGQLDREAERLRLITMTADERYAADMKRIGDLEGAGKIDPETARRAGEMAAESYDAANEAASRFRDTQYALEDGLNDVMNGTRSAGDVAKEIFMQMVMDILGVEDSLASLSSGFRDMLDGAFGGGGGIGGFFSGLFGGGGGAGAAVAVGHEGMTVGQGSRYRNMASSGLGARERLIVAEDGEELRTRAQQNAAQMGRGGDVYNIDARGADREGIMRLEAQIKQQGGQMRKMQKALPGQVRGLARDQFTRAGSI